MIAQLQEMIGGGVLAIVPTAAEVAPVVVVPEHQPTA